MPNGSACIPMTASRHNGGHSIANGRPGREAGPFQIGYLAGGGCGIIDDIRIFHFPPSRTYVAVQWPATSMGPPLWFLPVARNVPIPSAVSAPNGQT